MPTQRLPVSPSHQGLLVRLLAGKDAIPGFPAAFPLGRKLKAATCQPSGGGLYNMIV